MKFVVTSSFVAVASLCAMMQSVVAAPPSAKVKAKFQTGGINLIITGTQSKKMERRTVVDWKIVTKNFDESAICASGS